MPNQIPIETGNYYHIFNHSNGNENIFFTEKNYNYFLLKYKEHISPIADTFAYCLMPNHFHFLVRIKDDEHLFNWVKEKGKFPDILSLTDLKTLSADNNNPLDQSISKQFSKFFSGYSMAINKQEGRMGSLFNRQFKRRKITSDKQLRDTLMYIHNNPVHHGFTESAEIWPHSSYNALLSNKPTLLFREEVFNWFEDKENFIFCHKKYMDVLINEG